MREVTAKRANFKKYINIYNLRALGVPRKLGPGLSLVVNIATMPTCRIVNIVIVPKSLATVLVLILAPPLFRRSLTYAQYFLL